MNTKWYDTLISGVAGNDESLKCVVDMLSPTQNSQGYSDFVGNDGFDYIIPHDPLSAKLLGAFLYKEEDKPYCWAGIDGDALEFQRTLCKIGSTINKCAYSVKSTIMSNDLAMVNTSSLFSINSGYWYNLDKVRDEKIIRRNLFGDEIDSLIYHLLVNDTMSPEMERNLKSLLLILQILHDESSGYHTQYMKNNLRRSIGRSLYRQIIDLPNISISKLLETLEYCMSYENEHMRNDCDLSIHDLLLMNDDDRAHEIIDHISVKYGLHETSIMLTATLGHGSVNVFEGLGEDLSCGDIQNLMVNSIYALSYIE